VVAAVELLVAGVFFESAVTAGRNRASHRPFFGLRRGGAEMRLKFAAFAWRS
jgi:hypothetical protein